MMPTTVKLCICAFKCINGIDIAAEVSRQLSQDHNAFHKAYVQQMLTLYYHILR